MDAVTWIEMFKTLKEAGYSEAQIASFNRVTVLELRTIRAAKVKYIHDVLDELRRVPIKEVEE